MARDFSSISRALKTMTNEVEVGVSFKDKQHKAPLNEQKRQKNDKYGLKVGELVTTRRNLSRLFDGAFFVGTVAEEADENRVVKINVLYSNGSRFSERILTRRNNQYLKMHETYFRRAAFEGGE